MDKILDQALAYSVNYVVTGRPSKGIEVAAQVRKIDPTNHISQKVMDWVATGHCDLVDFIGDYWTGQSLEGKSIEIFCDQGMGDLLNLIRYLKVMKQRWNCKIVLVNYAFFDEMNKLVSSLGCVDEFTGLHVKCDYFTNILSIPALLNGLVFDIYYPTHWVDVMRHEIPSQEIVTVPDPMQLEPGFKVGLAWRSNLDNPIGQKKSFGIVRFAQLEDGVNELYSVIPSEKESNMIICVSLADLWDTARLMASLDVVVSVDTAALHLAGMMGKKTLGLLPFEADPRWGYGSSTVWYPTMELFRQGADLDWEPVIQQVKERLVSLRSIG
jgi:hypothetical protein